MRAELNAWGGDASSVLAKSDHFIPDEGIDLIVPAGPQGSKWVPGGRSTWHFTSERLTQARFATWIRTQLGAPAVKRERAAGATTVLVATVDPPAKKVSELEKLYKRVKILTLASLEAWTNAHPALVNTLRPMAALPTLEQAMRSIRGEYAFIWDDHRISAADRIRSCVAPAAVMHDLRVEGATGIGKTRLVLQALSDVPGAAQRVLYCPDSTYSPDHPALQLVTSIGNDPRRSVILVLDECDQAGHQSWKTLALGLGCGPRLKLVSVGPTAPLLAGATLPSVVGVEALSEDLVRNFLHENFQLPEATASLVVGECKGFIKAAAVLARHLATNPADADPPRLAELIAREEIFRRALGDRAEFVQMVALFADLGWEEPQAQELTTVAAHYGVGLRPLRTKLGRVHTEGLLQPTHSVRFYVTPKVLADSLALLAAREQGPTSLADLFFAVPHVARLAMLDRFIPLHADSHVDAVLREIARRLGQPQGGAAGSGPSDDEARYLRRLSGVAAKEVVASLQARLRSLSPEELRAQVSARLELVSALERLATDPILFVQAAELLLALAEAENEPGNNATGVWVGLFGAGLAGTQADNDTRLSVLQAAAAAASPEKRRLAAKAVMSMLYAGTWHQRMEGFDPERPQDFAVLPQLHREAWRMLIDLLGDRDGAVRRQAAEGVRHRFVAAFCRVPAPALEALERAATMAEPARRAAYAAAAEAMPVLAKDLSPELVDRFQAVLTRLAGTSFRDRLVRCAGERLRNDWSEEAQAFAAEQCRSLATEALARPDLLLAELPWLGSNAAERAFEFGRELGALDRQGLFLPALAGMVHEGRGILALAGFAAGLASHDAPGTDQLLEEWAKNGEMFARASFEATYRLGPGEPHLRRLVAMVQSGVVPARALQALVYGSWAARLPAASVQELLEVVGGSKDPVASSGALEVVNRWRQLHPEGTTDADAFDDQVLDLLPAALSERSGMGIFAWTKVAGRVTRRAPVRVAFEILRALPREGPSRSDDRELVDLLIDACRRAPALIWPSIGDRLLKDYGFVLSLAERVDALPAEILTDWAAEHVPQGPAVLARIVPVRGQPISELTAAVLDRFGRDRAVQGILSAHHLSGTYAGSFEDHGQAHRDFLAERRREAKEWAKAGSPAVRAWARAQIARIHAQLRQGEAAVEAGHR